MVQVLGSLNIDFKSQAMPILPTIMPHGQGLPVHDNREVFEEGELRSPILSRSDHFVVIERK